MQRVMLMSSLQNRNRNLSLFLTLVLVMPAAAFSEPAMTRQQASDAIRKIRSAMDAQTYPLYAGFPLCSDILKRRGEEAKKIFYSVTVPYLEGLEAQYGPELSQLEAEMRTKTEALNRKMAEEMHLFSETVTNESDVIGPMAGEKTIGFDFTWRFVTDSIGEFPSAEVRERQSQYSHPPAHPIGTRTYRPSGGGFCFDGNTPVIALSRKVLVFKEIASPQDRHVFPASHRIDEVYNDTWVLSSTVAVMDDPRYVKDCWAPVAGVDVGEVHDWEEERFKRIDFTSSDGKSFHVDVTPGHRFYSMLPEGWDWLPAGDEGFKPGLALFSNCSGGTCTVSKVADSKAPGGWRKVRRIIQLGSKGYPQVYNLRIPETFVYYVGEDVNRKVLVHNTK